MLYHIYCDESRQTRDRFMIFSGIIISDKSVSSVDNTMAKYRNEERMMAELKWSKVSRQKLREYKIFIDYFFALNTTNRLHFKSIIFDNQKADHKSFSDGDREKGFQKFYYQLLLMFGREYYNHDKDTKFIIYPDYRHSKYSLKELKDILNNGLAKRLKKPGIKPYRSIEPKTSHDCELRK